jgi:CheY-like chemotaxis protein
MNSVFTQTEGQPRSPRVLIAEDEVLLRLMVADALREHGFEVFEAANAPEALAVLETTSGIDVVISDMHMQRKDDGMALACFLRQNHPDISILLASAHAVPPASEGSPFDAFFIKPYRPEQFVEWIEQHFGPTGIQSK